MINLKIYRRNQYRQKKYKRKHDNNYNPLAANTVHVDISNSKKNKDA